MDMTQLDGDGTGSDGKGGESIRDARSVDVIATSIKASASRNRAKKRKNALIIGLVHGDIFMLSGDDYEVRLSAMLGFHHINGFSQVLDKAYWYESPYVPSPYFASSLNTTELFLLVLFGTYVSE
jgi:hypothetical protein